MHTLALIFAGGEPIPSRLAEGLPSDALVIVADSGVEHALALGRRIDLVVGDLDSADPAAVETAERAGAEVRRFSAQKDQTDLELALEAARAAGASHVIVVGGHGGRLDHLLANALLLGHAGFADLIVEWLVPGARITVVTSTAELRGNPGDLLSLLAVGGPARGVLTTGLRYPLREEDLLPGSTRGVSNEFTASRARVEVASGVLLAVQPDRIQDSPELPRPLPRARLD